ncbi:MAG TPA: thiamine-phosphate kinase [Candidatus Omnitrophota bacterium]|nr:thiamine-phosphate kinase [Candidatus Omnitrophota bacterium]HPD84797.1 thiamine-phosphate kinase [Candidatus Omnitrophota bacterium]HRZ03655.1 thiamine-phosphate kinase [Candidatus Omnitrophota bacterium]
MSHGNKVRLKDIGEFGLIGRIAKSARRQKGVIKGIGDDTAVLAYSPKRYLLFTADMLVEGKHFTKIMGPELIGRKSLACSISDIAAMGGVPTYAVVSLGVPPGLSVDYVQRIYKGMSVLAKQFKIGIVGGDTVSSEKIVINVALLGEAQKRQIIFRSGAKKGDKIFVTGPLGRSLTTGKHLNFTPRIKEAQYLVKNFTPTAMIDISDGLAGDLNHILEESKVGAVIFDRLIPRNHRAQLRNALYDGEDFELIFTLPSSKVRALIKRHNRKFKFYYIGDVTGSSRQLVLVDNKGKRRLIAAKSYIHF